jgi:tetratricopeptide (TPR) repeat protein
MSRNGLSKGRRTLLGFAVAVLAPVLALASPARAEWLKAESDHFVVYGRSERSVRQYAAMLEDFDDRLRRLHGRPKDEVAPRKLPVYLVSDFRQLKRVMPSASEGIAGAYFSVVPDVFVVAIRDSSSGDYDQNKGDDTVLHEYVHHFMLQYYPSAYPAWLVEGYAEYYMTADLAKSRMVIGGVNAGRAYSLTQPGGWIPMQDVLGKRPGELKTPAVYSYYAQAWLLTHYILSDPARHKLLSPYLDAVRGGRDPVKAWQDVYGDDPAGLRRKLQAYMNHPIPAGALPRTGPVDPPMTVTRLSPGADDLLLESQRLKLGVPKDERAKALATIRANAAEHPGDPFSQLVLARAETELGDRAAGEKILNGLLAADPKNEAALVALGESRLMAADDDAAQKTADLAQAGKLFARAFKINPDNPETLHGYAEARAQEPLTANMVDIRIKAVMLAPQVGHLRLDAARALIQTDDLVLARTMLAPLASSPHGGDEVETAQAMLKDIEPKAGHGDKAEAAAGTHDVGASAAKASPKTPGEGDKAAAGS